MLHYSLLQIINILKQTGNGNTLQIVVSVDEWLKCRAYDQHGFGSKPTHAILLYPWERHLTALSFTWWS